VSKEAVKWAMDDAPMLLTSKGKPDSTARHVLQVLAEHAHKDGSNAYPTLRRLRYRTGYDRSTVQRALRRLTDAHLITATGVTEFGVTIYRLALSKRRPASDMEELEAEEAAFRAAAAERKRRSRAKTVTDSAPVTVTHSESVTDGDVTHSESVRHALKMRDVTDSEYGCHTLSAALTSNEPVVEPVENRRPNGRRPTTGSQGLPTSGSAALEQQRPDEVQNAASAEAVGCVIGLLPRALRDQLPNPVPKAVTDAIASELRRGLTADTLVARAERRWLAHGYDLDNDTQGGGPGLLRPVGVAIALVRRGQCTHAQCDDGTDLNTGQPCRTCEREAEDRRTVQAAPIQGAFLAAVPDDNPIPPPRTGRMRSCNGCERPSRKLPADGWCRNCRPASTERTSTA
jgi:DNA-binding transcriptional ArsR family regulator